MCNFLNILMLFFQFPTRAASKTFVWKIPETVLEKETGRTANISGKVCKDFVFVKTWYLNYVVENLNLT